MQIIGIGNRLRGDDGIGPIMIEILEKQQEFISKHELHDISGDAFSLLEILSRNNETKLIIDCCDFDGKAGTVKCMNINSENLEKCDNMLSLHSLHFSEVFTLAKSLNPYLKCRLVAIQPENIHFNRKLSEAVEKNIPYINERIKEETRHYAE